ncbi:MAG: hypothetical protein ACXW2E_01730 [Nitrososphaeraceae archaeon]
MDNNQHKLLTLSDLCKYEIDMSAYTEISKEEFVYTFLNSGHYKKDWWSNCVLYITADIVRGIQVLSTPMKYLELNMFH